MKKTKLEKNNLEINSIKTYYICKCDCGNIITTTKDRLLKGNTKSCGCINKNIYVEKEDCYEIYDCNKESSFIISKIDFANVKKYTWSNRSGRWFTKINGKEIKIHQFIASLMEENYKKGIDIPDHIDRNPNNNKRDNIRLVNTKLNNRNTKTNKNNKSGKQGVSFNKNRQKWVVYINTGTKRISKSFNLLNDAIIQRKTWEKEFGYIGE